MCFRKEHTIAQEYFYQTDENLGFTHNVSNRNLHYYISFKSRNKNFNGDREVQKFNKFFDEFEFADEAGQNLNTILKKLRVGPNLIMN